MTSISESNGLDNSNITRYRFDFQLLHQIIDILGFSNDKIAEYWYNIGSEHNDNDNILRLCYAIEKLSKEEPNHEEIFQKLQKIIKSTPLEEVYEWDSQK